MLPMPCTLEWPRIGMSPALRPAHHAAQQGEVRNRLHGVHAMGVVRYAHGPTKDHIPGGRIAFGDFVDFGL